MGSQQLYNLTWGEFGTIMTSTFQSMRDQNEMVDVTLAADGKAFKAHKLVLSAASPLLKELIQSTESDHPVIMLVGIMATDVEALLHFVYQGEVSVDATRLQSLLQAAHCLDIQALSSQTLNNEQVIKEVRVIKRNTSSTIKNELTPPNVSRELCSTMKLRKRKRKKSLNMEPEDPKHGPTESAKSLCVGVQKFGRVNESHIQEGEDGVVEAQCNIEAGATELTPSTEGKLRCASEQPCICSQCGLLIRQARNLRRHLLTSCRPPPDVESQEEIMTPSPYFQAIALLPNQLQEELLQRYSKPQTDIDQKFASVSSAVRPQNTHDVRAERDAVHYDELTASSYCKDRLACDDPTSSIIRNGIKVSE